MKTENKKRNSVKAVPDGFHTVTPFIVVNNAEKFIDFLKKAFDAKLQYQMKIEETNKISHATIAIGDSIIMISDASEKMSPSPCMLYLYVEDVDALYKKALDASGTSLREPLTEFYGDRSAGIKDAWGNQWWIATHVEDVSEEELKIRKEQFTHQHAHA